MQRAPGARAIGEMRRKAATPGSPAIERARRRGTPLNRTTSIFRVPVAAAVLVCSITMLLYTGCASAGITREGEPAPTDRQLALERRLAPELLTLSNDNDLRWDKISSIVEKSDPVLDAQSDLGKGIVGLMAYTDPGWGIFEVPGLKCRNVFNVAFFTFYYSDTSGEKQRSALDRFSGYARLYNETIYDNERPAGCSPSE